MNYQSNRPLSPHLQIYKPQITSVMSIMHRGTGVFLILGILMIMLWTGSLAIGPAAFSAYQGTLQTGLGKVFLFILSFCLFYHLANGIRHLLWDFGWGYEFKQVYLSGWLVVMVAVLFTGALWARLIIS